MIASEPIIELRGLSKQFKDVLAVDELDLTVYKGDVFGFLGPNGAGKSTSIRMMLSLIFPTKGTIKIFGKELQHNRNDILQRLGGIVEKPDFYLYLSAYKNLEILGRLSDTDVSNKRIMEMLELVGLEKRAKSKVKTFSHGMKQRLGLAQALLHNPELIILDEPTTGLDPQGMKEIRDLIMQLSREKQITIFLSSHILYEVELVTNRMIILNRGKKVVEGLVKELLDNSQLKVTYEVNDTATVQRLINENSYADTIEFMDDQTLIVTIQKEAIPLLNKKIIESGIDLYAATPKRSLEEYFLSLT